MATDILIKRSTTPGAVPTTSDLSTGELAINTADKRLFTNNAGTIVEIGIAPTSIDVTNNATVGGTLDVTGDTTVADGTATNWTVTGTLTVPTPSGATDAASKGYVDTADNLKLDKAGDTMSGNLAMGTNKVTGLGTPTNDTDAATKGYVDAQVTSVIDSAPGALDTLNELAAAINDDANFATTVTNALAGKLALAGGTMTGNIVMGSNAVTSTATPATNDTLTRKGYVDAQDATKLNLSGGTMTGDIVMGANAVTSTATPATDDTLTRKGYVDSILGSATDAATSASEAATSASNAATSASNASTSASNAATSASNASDSADAASSSASAASSSATSASNSATAASNSASAAATSATNAENAYDSFDDRYLGAKASDPSVDNDGDALIEGALYFNTTEDEMRVYTGNAWVAVQDLTGDVTTNSVTTDALDLAAIAESKAVTAVDVFVYDTRKDSDGGAWRKRTQHTSWYNETLNTATRGARREFPAVAVIVAEATKVTIYDGDDPDLPMWMIRNFPSGFGPNSVVAADGQVCVGRDDAGLTAFNFPSAEVKSYRDTNYQGGIDSGGLVSGSFNGDWDGSLPVIINDAVKDVAMTVLPNAPIDSATGLPVPTIAVATDGGVSVIKDDGAVVDSEDTVGINFVNFSGQRIIYSRKGTSLPARVTAPVGELSDGFTRDLYQINTNPPYMSSVNNNCQAAISSNLSSVGYDTGFDLLRRNDSDKETGMVVYTTSTYNTGWMNGDIKGAFLSDTDDTDVTGSELVTNGDFATGDLTGWTDESGAGSSVAVVSNAVEITGVSPSDRGKITQQTNLVVGKTYILSLNVTGGITSQVLLLGMVNETVTSGFYQFTFVCNNPTRDLDINVSGNGTNTFDNISLRLAEEDRSVNGNGLQVYGTITKTPVATGADLVAYSGFSSTNYLEQPYNSDLDFGTGDFCVMGWVKATSSANHETLLSRSNREFDLSIASGGKLRFYSRNTSDTLVFLDSSSTVQIGSWFFACVVHSGGSASIYLDGVLNSSGSLAADIDSGDAQLFLGIRNENSVLSEPADNTLLSLFRISATAPTAEQIKKIYEDEKVLFQENAQATLYGSSDAVTALAYDDDTNLLHVGTSAGRSVFSGLRRVENTTDAVGTAISASDGMVVEE